MDNKLLKSAVAVALGTATVAAHAGGWYIAAGGGEMFSPLSSSEAIDDWTNVLKADDFTFNNTGSTPGTASINNHVGIWRAGVGFQIIPVLGVEAEYLGLGTARAKLTGTTVDGPEGAIGSASYSRHAYGVSAVAKLPLPVSPFIRAGLLEWTQNGTINGTVTDVTTPINASKHSTGSSAYGGVGLDYGIPLSPVSLRLEGDTFKIAGSTPKVVTLSVIFSF